MIRAGVLLLGWAAAATAAAGNPEGRVQSWLESWTGLSGRFEQTVSSPTLPSDQVESGLFEVSRPDRMRWDYTYPETKLAVTDGVHTWLYLPDDRQVVRGTLERLRKDSAVSLLLTGTLRLADAFEVVRAEEAGGEIRLEMRPRRPSEAIAGVDLRAASDGKVLGFTVTDPSGNRVTWRFRDLVRDPDLEASRFTFQIPPGIEVQDLEDVDARQASP
jgi:outer membrane lipoprotein carrier protein